MVERQNRYYCNIQDWMLEELGLRGSELMVYAIIYGYSRMYADGYTGSLIGLADRAGISRTTAMRCLKSLTAKGYIIKNKYDRAGRTVCQYITATDAVVGRSEIAFAGCAASSENGALSENSGFCINPPQACEAGRARYPLDRDKRGGLNRTSCSDRTTGSNCVTGSSCIVGSTKMTLGECQNGADTGIKTVPKNNNNKINIKQAYKNITSPSMPSDVAIEAGSCASPQGGGGACAMGRGIPKAQSGEAQDPEPSHTAVNGPSPCGSAEDGAKAMPSVSSANAGRPVERGARHFDAEFEAIWALYPAGRKQGKDAARRAYTAARRGGTTAEQVREGLEAYTRYVKGVATQYIKLGGTWFTGRCWLDEYPAGGALGCTYGAQAARADGNAPANQCGRDMAENAYDGGMNANSSNGSSYVRRGGGSAQGRKNRALSYRQTRYSAEDLRALGIDLGDGIYEDESTNM